MPLGSCKLARAAGARSSAHQSGADRSFRTPLEALSCMQVSTETAKDSTELHEKSAFRA